ncbi:hypothetical protein FACS1894105_08580 [Clostridia bacterium]|nr:hypothetical protein FACS1894105_08580 [Clostridia bacterium]
MAGCCINDLKDKEVINIYDGRKIGFVDDVEVDIISGKLCAIVVPIDGKLFGLFKQKNLVIMWECIEKIGDDTILVKIDTKEYARNEEIIEVEHGKKRKSFF